MSIGQTVNVVLLTASVIDFIVKIVNKLIH